MIAVLMLSEAVDSVGIVNPVFPEEAAVMFVSRRAERECALLPLFDGDG